jgi:hypothetical protein
MPDDHDDRRDDALAGALAVEPLDQLTRRRLVARALDEAPGVAVGASRSVRARVAAVAAAVAFVALGVVALALPGSETAEVAGRAEPSSRPPLSGAEAPSAAPAPSSDQATALERSPASDRAADSDGAPTATVAVDLGDLGDVGRRGSRARVLTRARPLVDGVPGVSTTFAGDACASRELAGVVATGTGTLDGRGTTVVVTRRADGSLVARAVVADRCDVRALR